MSKLRRSVLVVCVLALVGSVAPTPTASSLPVVASDNVQLVANIPDLGAIGGQIIGDVLYMTTLTGVRTFDVSNGIPVPMGALALPNLQNEAMSTNGELLLVASDQIVFGGTALNFLHVVDVSNPRVLLLRSTIQVTDAHTATCIADCRYAWTSGGDVVDLTDPDNPVHRGRIFNYAHKTDVDEAGYAWASPGFGSGRVYDTTNYGPHNLLNPPLVASSSQTIGWHGTLRPNASELDPAKMSDSNVDPGELVLGTDENWLNISNGFCGAEGPFITSHFRKNSSGQYQLQRLGTWRIGMGTAPGSLPTTATCTSHWFDHHESVVVNGWMGQGTRFLDVSDPRNIRQIGYFMPVATQAWMALFHEVTEGLHEVTDGVLAGVYVYVFDAVRGLDVLRFTGQAGDDLQLAPHYNTPAMPAMRVSGLDAPAPPAQLYCDIGRSF